MNRKDFFAGMALHALLNRVPRDEAIARAWGIALAMDEAGPPEDDGLRVEPPSPTELLERLEAMERERKERER